KKKVKKRSEEEGEGGESPLRIRFQTEQLWRVCDDRDDGDEFRLDDLAGRTLPPERFYHVLDACGSFFVEVGFHHGTDSIDDSPDRQVSRIAHPVVHPTQLCFAAVAL